MNARVLLATLAALGPACFLACQSFGAGPSEAPLDASASASSDASSEDGGDTLRDGTTNADAAPVNLVPSGDFENVSDANCGIKAGWSANNGNTTLSVTVKHAGKVACMVCATQGSTKFSLNAPQVALAVPGNSFHFRAFVRRVAGFDTPTKVELVPRVYGSDTPERDGPSMVSAISADEWQQVDDDFTVPNGSAPLGQVGSYLDFVSDGSSTSCAIVDDYQVWRTN